MRLRFLGSVLAASALLLGSRVTAETAAIPQPVSPVSPEQAAVIATNQLGLPYDAQSIGGNYILLSTRLSSSNEVPSNPSDAIGTAVIGVSADLSTIWWYVIHSVDGATAAHIHRGAAGTNGPVIYDFRPTPGSGVIIGSSPFNETDWADLSRGRMYVNVHSPTYPGGEIRGQLSVIGDVTLPTINAPVAAPTIPPLTVPGNFFN